MPMRHRLMAFLAALGLTAAAAACVSSLAARPSGPDPLAATGQWSANQAGQAPTPPMGWNTWNAFYYNIDEQKVMASVQIIVDSGLAAAGYRNVNLDDGWWLRRRQPDGRMIINAQRFPSAATADGETSFRPLTDRLHAMGLRAGIYSDIGRNTCGQAYGPDTSNQPQGSMGEREVGLYDHIDQDIALYFEEWGFDYIKVDGCGIRAFGAAAPRVRNGTYRELAPLIDMHAVSRTDIAAVRGLFGEVARSLARHNRDGDYTYSICLWGSANVRAWGKDVGNLSRTSDDISASWPRMLTNFDTTVTRALYAQPGAWNDPDMLFIGSGDFDADHMVEARSHFGLWAIVNAPLLIGFDLRRATGEQLALLGNRDIIALNQDPAGHQAVPAYLSEDVQILVKTLADGDKGVAIFNRGMAPIEAVLTAAHLKMDPSAPIALSDLWTGARTTFEKERVFAVAPRQTLMFRARGARALANGVYLSEVPGDINVAADGIVAPTADPTIHRSVTPWTRTRGPGEMPSYAGWGGAQADRSPFSEPLRMAGRIHEIGIGVLANSRLEARNRGFRHFSASVGIDDAAALRDRPATFAVYGDGRLIAQSRAVRADEGPVEIEADIEGVAILELVTRAAGETGLGLPVVWGEARLLR
ncbi:MAG: NPCBM/NEW2 domain-containing protein [Hyphomonadaceae bacterium]|nr:NPCBM/NEW2 domain-containing protein [Hyphomonadaceae bacterium]